MAADVRPPGVAATLGRPRRLAYRAQEPRSRYGNWVSQKPNSRAWAVALQVTRSTAPDRLNARDPDMPLWRPPLTHLRFARTFTLLFTRIFTVIFTVSGFTVSAVTSRPPLGSGRE